MKSVSVTIETDNVAFGDEPQYEIGRILRALAEKLEEYPDSLADRIPLYDKNGSLAGSAVLR